MCQEHKETSLLVSLTDNQHLKTILEYGDNLINKFAINLDVKPRSWENRVGFKVQEGTESFTIKLPL